MSDVTSTPHPSQPPGRSRSNVILAILATVLAIAGTLALVSPPASAAAGSNRLLAGETLDGERAIVSPNRQCALVAQKDGNTVLYQNRPGRDRQAIFSTATDRFRGAVLMMQKDGNLVVIAPGNKPVWANQRAGYSGSYLEIQDDCNLVEYQPGGNTRRVVWDRFGARPGPLPTSTPPPSTGGGGGGGSTKRPFSTCPVPGAKSGRPYGSNYSFTDEWNVTSGNTGTKHAAIDIHAPKGARIVAPASGTVFKVGTITSKFGTDRRLWMRLDSGEYVFMNHLNSWDPSIVKATSPTPSGGIRVKAGQTIGAVGQPSNGSHTHLHLHLNTRGPDSEYYQPERNVYGNLVAICKG